MFCRSNRFGALVWGQSLGACLGQRFVFSFLLGAWDQFVHDPYLYAIAASALASVSSVAIAHIYPEPFAQTLWVRPETILGVGFLFAALTGIFFKESFCFNRLETKLLTPLVPVLLLGHLFGWLSLATEKVLLAVWAGLFIVFALRKVTQAIPPDIGDKSVFVHLREAHNSSTHS